MAFGYAVLDPPIELPSEAFENPFGLDHLATAQKETSKQRDRGGSVSRVFLSSLFRSRGARGPEGPSLPSHRAPDADLRTKLFHRVTPRHLFIHQDTLCLVRLLFPHQPFPCQKAFISVVKQECHFCYVTQ